MPRKKKPITFTPDHPTYTQEVRRPLTQLIVIAPLLLFFLWGQSKFGSDLLIPEYMQLAFHWLNTAGRYLPAGLILIVLVFQHYMQNDPLRVDLWAVGGTLVESAIWALPLLAVNWITSAALPAGQLAPAGEGTLQACLSAVGAGVYEEFLFRLVWVHIAVVVFVDLLHGKKDPTQLIAIFTGAIAFSLAHFSVAQWTGPAAAPWGAAIFLAIAGLWWGVLYLWRGYAVAACSHIAWNLLVLAWNQ